MYEEKEEDAPEVPPLAVTHLARIAAFQNCRAQHARLAGVEALIVVTHGAELD